MRSGRKDRELTELDTIGYHLRRAVEISREASTISYTDEMRAMAKRAITHLERVIERCEALENTPATEGKVSNHE